MNDHENPPMTMTADQSAALLDCVRNPRILRYFVEFPLNELVRDLLRADIERNPAPEIYVEHYVIGLITVLHPLLKATAAVFFDLTHEEREQRWESLDEHIRDALRHTLEENEWSMDDWEDMTDPVDRAYTSLSESLRKIDTTEWKHLAFDVVAKPEAMIRNARATEAFRLVLDLTRHGERWLTPVEIDVVNVVHNAPAINNLLTLLRDLRRVFR